MLRKSDVIYLLAFAGALFAVAPTSSQDKTAGPPREKDWWAFRPLARPPVPEAKFKDWARNPIDHFIGLTLDGKGMKPSPEADRATFIRRATYDLHGLPPTPAEIDAFVKDRDADAFEKLIDRLLASPRYGERWGRHWLDVIHYADTHGFDKDKRRLWAWLFRDWIIRAINRDMPYRRFIRYQIAGDVLFPAEPDGIIATGFIAAGPWDFVGQVELREGTVDKEKTRTLDRDDMVANTMSTFVSMTTHCARCHDHKFDPIPQKDYYRLQAVFAGVERGDRTLPKSAVADVRTALEESRQRFRKQRDELIAKMKEGWQAGEITAKEVEQMLENPMLAIKLGLKPPPKDLDLKDRRAWIMRDAQRLATVIVAAVHEGKLKLANMPALPNLKKSSSNGYHSAIFAKPDNATWVQVDLGESQMIEEIVLVPARPVDFPDTPGFGFPVRFRVEISDDPTFKSATPIADHAAEDYPNPGDGPIFFRTDKKGRFVRVTATKLWERTKDFVFALGELQVLSGKKNLARGRTVTAADSIEAGLWSKKYLVDNFDSRRELPDLAEPVVRQRLKLEQHVETLERHRDSMLNFFRYPSRDPDGKRSESPLDRLDRQLAEVAEQMKLTKDTAKVYAAVPIKPRPIHLLHRGDVERKKELLGPGTLTLLPGLEAEFKLADPDNEGSRRAALADWLCDSKNVLTWRSIANRIWHYHFGRGLVDTPNDFGKNGSRPTHPELLDWLAVEFRDGGGSMKKLHRLIMLSATYRQSTKHNPEFAKIDADNRYLWRMNRRRLDAESIRDSVLAASGKLDLTMYGPGFDLFRFKDDHSPIYDHTDLASVNDPATYRRTVYRFVVRSVPNPFLDSLDCADPNINVPVRNTTLTALQALALLNNPFMVKQAEFFAQRVQKSNPEVEGQIEAAYRLALGRLPRAEERTAMVAYARRHGLANACRVLLNTNEFLFVD